MNLTQKGTEAYISIEKLKVTMKWTIAADFDIAAVYKTKIGHETTNGRMNIVYFGDKGNLNTMPYIQLSEDAGVGDKGGDNEEILHISSLKNLEKVWIFCWDYGMVQDGKKARFKDSDIKLLVEDQNKQKITVNLDTGDFCNVVCIATIDNSNPIGAKLINTSLSGTLKGLKTLEQLLAIIENY